MTVLISFFFSKLKCVNLKNRLKCNQQTWSTSHKTTIFISQGLYSKKNVHDVTLYNHFNRVAFVGEACIVMHDNHIGTVQVVVCDLLHRKRGRHRVAGTSDSRDLLIILVEIEVQTARLLWCAACGSDVFPLKNDIRLHLQHWDLKACIGLKIL